MESLELRWPTKQKLVLKPFFKGCFCWKGDLLHFEQKCWGSFCSLLLSFKEIPWFYIFFMATG